MWSLTTWLGLAAALLTTAANIPQVVKSWRTRETSDLSLAMIATLASGLALWVVYGFLQSDPVIMIANAAGMVLSLNLLALKLWYG
jgi:MtN3 and saliva related transmembrane protein